MKIHAFSLAVITALSTATSASPVAENNDNHLLITATRSEQAFDSTLVSADVITRDEIDLLQPRSVAELLTRVAGIDITTQGGAGQATSMFVRGDSGNHVLVLVNGVRVGSSTLGVKALETIEPAQIERVEIIRGPRAAIWGSDAISGVVQIFTRDPQTNSAQLNLSVGSEGYQSQTLSGAAKLGEHKVAVTLSNSGAEGFNVRDDLGQLDDDGYRRVSGNLNAEFVLSDDWTFNALLMQEQGNSEYDSSFGDVESDFDNQVVSFSFDYLADGLSQSIGIAKSSDQLSSELSGVFETKRTQLNYVVSRAVNDNWQLTAGADWYRDQVDGATAYSQSERDTKAGFIHAGYQKAALSAEIALRHDSVEGIESESTYSLGIGYQLTADLQLVANAGTGFKAPTFNDLYFPASMFSAGNPDLRSETSRNVEVALRGKTTLTQWQVLYFDNQVDDLIVWQPDANFVWSPQNVAEAELNGWEAKLGFHYASLSHELTLTLVDATDAQTGERLMNRAEEIANYTLGASAGAWQYDVHISYHGKRNNTDFDPITFMPSVVTLDAYTLLSASISYQLNDAVKIYLNASNLTDKEYQEVVHYNTAGREFYLGVDWQLF